jgi:hypothetical protein
MFDLFRGRRSFYATSECPVGQREARKKEIRSLDRSGRLDGTVWPGHQPTRGFRDGRQDILAPARIMRYILVNTRSGLCCPTRAMPRVFWDLAAHQRLQPSLSLRLLFRIIEVYGRKIPWRLSVRLSRTRPRAARTCSESLDFESRPTDQGRSVRVVFRQVPRTGNVRRVSDPPSRLGSFRIAARSVSEGATSDDRLHILGSASGVLSGGVQRGVPEFACI